MRDYIEWTSKWEGPFMVTKVSKKMISITDGTKMNPFHKSFLLPVAQKSNAADFKYDMEDLQ